ncbi:hypothetical protein ACJJIR_14590 [Microbulbifer sp. SSSA008]|uniref:hypothetical protein n=1 Tax=Microbulbifer sp. SSSA008 TaxID=3243380 RepID=UPI0040397CB8
MRSLNHKIFIMLFCVLIAVKLFTAEVSLADDPIVAFSIKKGASFDNKITENSHEDISKYIVLFTDENGFLGEKIYFILVDFLWWLIPVLYFVVVLGARYKSRL